MREKREDSWTMSVRTPRIRKAKVMNLIIKKTLLLLCALLATGCVPKIQPVDPQLVIKSDLLGFLQDDFTTREEVVLKLGLPSVQIEEGRILMYQLKANESGKWHLIAPQWDVNRGFRAWSQGTCSLVLVFGEDAVLRKHSLVIAQ